MSKSILALACVLALTAVSCSTVSSDKTSRAEDNWPNWRGPNYDGSSSQAGLPLSFSKTDNVKWVSNMPGPAASTPIVWGDKVFTTSTDEKAKKLLALCLDRNTGMVLWKRETGQKLSRDNRSNYASPSPATDGNIVVFFFGNGDLITCDFSGKEIWKKNLQKEYGDFAFQWTFSSSPLLHDNKLYLQILQRDSPVHGRGREDGESFLVAFDPMTGNELFKHVRPSNAKAESLEAFSTPIPFSHNGRDEILVVGGDCLTGHDPANGKELWRWGTWNPNRIGHWRLVPSPVAGEGVILACAPKGSPVYAVSAGATGTIDKPAWESANREVSSDVSTPLFYRGHFSVVNSDKKSISCVAPSGEVLWTGETGSRAKLEGSPTAADGRIYVMSHSGEVFVIASGPAFKMLHKADFGDSGDRDLRASISLAQGNLLIRTGSKLYCIGQ